MKTNLNQGWSFTKDADAVREFRIVEGEKIDLPHTWNGRDGQDGGNDYYRGVCYYSRRLSGTECTGEVTYLEFEGVNSSADIFVNGILAGHHDGGYSTFRVNISELLQDENDILVAVDNAPNDRVYPQLADFTFYGGIYRDVNLVSVPLCHLDLDYFGSSGVAVTPKVRGEDYEVTVDAFVTNPQGTVTFSILDRGIIIARKTMTAEEKCQADFLIKKAHLWQGRKDPYLYTVVVELSSGDYRAVRFGCRSFSMDPEKGFFLNGRSYPLRGVSRHQDRPDIGNALLPEHHKEDLAIIAELGATTIRLAHYQHSQLFYELCDELGFVVWAEIPYISKHMTEGQENTISQMKELIVQNYNHPCIVIWGLSNEITMQPADEKELLCNHHILNDLCHELDPTRKTAIALVSMCPVDAQYLRIPDCVAWNHYFGWYGGDTSMNGPWLDKFHARYPDMLVGMSEYGCEALNWHTSEPEQGDYTEEYQAQYHEDMIRQLFTRDYLFATYVWNMFDFAADARAEGGEDGRNHKGLVTFDRKYKKDAFYAYKAWLSDEPFVHICGKRYINRVEPITRVTVYSNQERVALFRNGQLLAEKKSEDHFFYFNVPNDGETILEARAGDSIDQSRICKVDEPDESYRMTESGDVVNWFELDRPPGRLSVLDKLEVIVKSPDAVSVLTQAVKKLCEKQDKRDADMESMLTSRDGMHMLGGFTVKRMLSMLGVAGLPAMGREDILELNRRLNQIEREGKSDV